ncbi:hypothetical protein [Alteribacter salitolerans]|nr:hypothetical protein [Alteribacter salitolerans]
MKELPKDVDECWILGVNNLFSCPHQPLPMMVYRELQQHFV